MAKGIDMRNHDADAKPARETGLADTLFPRTGRLVSIDALRGLAMFLILAIDIGGAPVFLTFTKLWGDTFAKATAHHFSYGFCEGLRLSFFAMPMFLFIVGLVIPISLCNNPSRTGQSVYPRIIKRTLILFLLGLIAGGQLLQFRFANMPLYNNVLEYISVGYLVCAMLVLNTSIRFQSILTALLLVAYWGLFMLVPVPGSQAGPFARDMNLAIYIDNLVLGPFHKAGSWQVLATLSFVANMLIGVLTGHFLVNRKRNIKTVKRLVLGGTVIILAGLLWSPFCPIIRSLWTSSYVLVTCGVSILLLAAFYLICDVWGYTAWALFFIVFGVNSIAVYMMAHLFDFRQIGNIFVGGLCRFLPSNVQDFVQAMAAMTVIWLIMYWMYRKRTFIKI